MPRVKYEHWLISVPNENDAEESWYYLRDALDKLKTCSEYRFNVPDLNVKTLDDVVAAIDDLGHLDVESNVLLSKIVNSLIHLVENQSENIEKHLKVENVSMRDYLIRFRWDTNKYPIRQSINRILPLIAKELTETELELNTKISAYVELDTSYHALERKRAGNFSTKYLGEHVSKDQFVTESEYLKTLPVAVPQQLQERWNSIYEKLHDDVVPQSSVYVDEDTEYCLFTVTVFKTAEKEFIEAAKKHGFIVRNDFKFNETEIYEFIKEVNRLQHEKHKMYKPLLRWVRASLSETYITLVHVKAAKLFVESVARYGLPPDFQTALLIIERAKAKRVEKMLKQLYGSQGGKGPKEKRGSRDRKTSGSQIEPQCPYVSTKIKASIEEILN